MGHGWAIARYCLPGVFALTATMTMALRVSSQPASPQTASSQPAPSPPGVPVGVGSASRQDFTIFDRGIGTVQSMQSVLVRARVDGTIDRIAFTEGQEVKPGDLLVVIDPRPYQAAFDQAAAKKAADTALLGNYKRDLSRFSELARSEFASRQSVDTQTAAVSQGTAAVQADDAQLALAKLNLDFTRITAPFGGRVGLRLVDQGNLVHASDTAGLVTINQVHPISVVFTLPQDQLPIVQDAIHAGKPLPVTAYGSDGKTLLSTGTLLTVDNAIDSSTGTIKLKATFPNADDRLWPGEFVNVHLQLRVQPSAVVAPSAAIMRGVDGLYVYMVKDNATAVVQPVEIGQDDGKVTLINSGLTGHETLVIRGQSRLTNGTRIAVQSPAGDKAGGGGDQKSSEQRGNPAPASTGG